MASQKNRPQYPEPEPMISPLLSDPTNLSSPKRASQRKMASGPPGISAPPPPSGAAPPPPPLPAHAAVAAAPGTPPLPVARSAPGPPPLPGGRPLVGSVTPSSPPARSTPIDEDNEVKFDEKAFSSPKAAVTPPPLPGHKKAVSAFGIPNRLPVNAVAERAASASVASVVSPPVPAAAAASHAAPPVGSYKRMAINLQQEIQNAPKKKSEEDIIPESFAGFANLYFNIVRTGIIFKNDVPTEVVMAFQSDIIGKNLLKTSNLHKDEAVSCFKTVQQFMGDHSTRLDREELVSLLQKQGVQMPLLRDELFAQVLKQINKNPNDESYVWGWKLLVLLLSAFPPSEKLYTAISNFVRSSYMGPDQHKLVSVFADLWILKAAGGNNVPIESFVPLTFATLESMMVRGLKPTMFSFVYSIDELLLLEEKYGNVAGRNPVPSILPMLMNAIKQLNGFHIQGIFRLAAEKSAIRREKTRIETGEEPEAKDPNVPADLLKQFFRYLPEPMIPIAHFQECMAVCDNSAACLEIILRVCHQAHIDTFTVLFRFLKELVVFESETSMGLDNLCLVFAPGIVRMDSEDPRAMLLYSNKQKLFMRNLCSVWPYP